MDSLVDSLVDTSPVLQVSVCSLGWAEVTPTGLVITNPNFGWEEYDGGVQSLLALGNASQWALGDAYNAGLFRFAHEHKDPSQVFSARNVRFKTLQNYAWVCNRYTFHQRRYPPSFTHHSIIAKLEPTLRDMWLVEAVRAVTGWDVSMWELIKVGERRLNLMRAFNAREGVGKQADTKPAKLLVPLQGGPTDGVIVTDGELEQAKALYYQMAGWDENGIPTRAKLKELGLGWLADTLPLDQ